VLASGVGTLAGGRRKQLTRHRAAKVDLAMQYAVVVEQAGEDYSAYVPDLPGCVATGRTTEEVTRDAIAFHLEGLRADGLPIPPATTAAQYVDVPA
jgi:predicted RNase H-like HicB family nuclease